MTNYQKIEATAYKIVSITVEEDGGGIIALSDPLPPVRMDAEYMAKYQPVAGGYCVLTEDGYKAYLPAEVVEVA